MAFALRGKKATEFRKLKISRGMHNNPEEGMCVMEAIAYFQDREFNDAPPCVAASIRELAVTLNDSFEDDGPALTRMVKPLIPLMVGTATKDKRVVLRRFEVMLVGLCRLYVPLTGGAAVAVEHFKAGIKNATTVDQVLQPCLTYHFEADGCSGDDMYYYIDALLWLSRAGKKADIKALDQKALDFIPEALSILPSDRERKIVADIIRAMCAVQ